VLLSVFFESHIRELMLYCMYQPH